MKAIIRGRRYDTETAMLVGESWSGGGKSDFRYWEAALYKTPRIDKDECRAMLMDKRGKPIIDVAPDRIRGHSSQFVSR